MCQLGANIYILVHWNIRLGRPMELNKNAYKKITWIPILF